MTNEWIGREVLGYEIDGALGRGGMGSVWRAHHADLGTVRAIKVLDPVLARDESVVARFVQEARIQLELDHPNIARTENFSREPLAIVSEYVEGRSLAAVIAAESGPITLERVLSLMDQIVAGVGHAHDKGIVHRDLKPSNVMVTVDGTVKLLDFGIAKVLDGSQHTRTGATIGTPEYMSPEQIQGSKDIDERSDVYALGVILYQLLTGRVPFQLRPDCSNDFAVRRSHVDESPPDPRALNPALPQLAADVALRALSKAPAERFKSTRDMAEALTALRSLPVATLAAAPPIGALPSTVLATPPELAPARTELTPASPAALAPTLSSPPVAPSPVATPSVRLLKWLSAGAAALVVIVIVVVSVRDTTPQPDRTVPSTAAPSQAATKATAEAPATQAASQEPPPPPEPPPAVATHVVFNTWHDRQAPYLALRSGASKDDAQLAELVDGTEVVELERSGKWLLVKVLSGPAEGKEGYAHGYHLHDKALGPSPVRFAFVEIWPSREPTTPRRIRVGRPCPDVSRAFDDEDFRPEMWCCNCTQPNHCVEGGGAPWICVTPKGAPAPLD